jgi:hypothetical protein
MATVDSVLGKLIRKKKNGNGNGVDTEDIVENLVKDEKSKDCKHGYRHGKVWKW